MKRWLLPASALVLVLIACGAGAKSAPRVTTAGERMPSVHAIVLRRKGVALHEARALVREFVPPPGARRDRARRDHGGILHQSGPGPLGEVVDAHRFWTVHRPLAAVTAVLEAHDPRGFRHLGAAYGTQKPHFHYVMRTLTRPASRHREPSRYITETALALPGRTVIRVEAKVAWIYPRSPREIVPVATREISVRAPRVSADVTSPAKVARIVRWFDALPISPPGIAVACPAVGSVDVTLTFRSAGGAPLARAKVPPAAANICDPISFSIDGKRHGPLVDPVGRESFVRRLQRLLGIRLLRTHPKG